MMILDEKIKEEIKARREGKEKFLRKHIDHVDLRTLKNFKEFYNFPLLSLLRIKDKNGYKIFLNEIIEDAGHLLEQMFVNLAQHREALDECRKLMAETMHLLQESETRNKEMLEQQKTAVYKWEETIKDLKKANRENSFLRATVKDLVKDK